MSDKMRAALLALAERCPVWTPPTDVALADSWDVKPIMFGRQRHMLSLASDGENVIICIESRPGIRCEWTVSPPCPTWSEQTSGYGIVPAMADDEATLAEAKRAALENYERWCAAPYPGNGDDLDMTGPLCEVLGVGDAWGLRAAIAALVGAS